MSDLEFATLLSMGYEKAYIERAIDVHRKSKYGTNWNLSILCEIIVRLQEKDERDKLLLSAHSGQPPSLALEQSVDLDPIHHPYYNNVVVNHDVDAANLNAAAVNHSEAKPYGYHLQNDYHDGLSSDSEQGALLDLGDGVPPQHQYGLQQEHPPLDDDPVGVFRAHFAEMSIPLRLRVNDFVDYRYENGRYLLCKVIAKSQQLSNMMLLHPVGKPIYDTKYDRLVNIYEEYAKLAAARSVCLRKIAPSHSFSSLAINDYVDINPHCNGHRGWKNGKIIKLDCHSSQIKVVYHHEGDGKNYSFWVHLMNKDEVAEEELPAEARAVPKPKRKGWLKARKAKRKALEKQVLSASKRREEWLAVEESKAGGPPSDAFDTQVVDMLRTQAEAVGVAY